MARLDEFEIFKHFNNILLIGAPSLSYAASASSSSSTFCSSSQALKNTLN